MILLDTSILIDLLANKKQAVRLISKYKELPTGISVITLAELEVGFLCLKTDRQKKAREKLFELIKSGVLEVFEITAKIALEYANLQARLIKVGKPISGFDGLVAATANFYNATFLTSDSGFSRIKNLKIVTT
ncbi:type II toxin-antitoxin system VapC family toxin [Candidatus Gottesmanbacteria bacterium]|nr:type II toxin-antitoxin system VapC family toxin [Candidatus Gottesmanbacteria bacterium]MBI5452940.1 type II toxin-antitoxin system VapC family toxin [Candidatus Gottesmanbacteria bacterium]